MKNEVFCSFVIFPIFYFFSLVFYHPDYDNAEREQRLQVPNRALASYLARPNNIDYDDFYPSEYKKRSMYRKRGKIMIYRWMISIETKVYLKSFSSFHKFSKNAF